jgi:sulfopyruvate decarboxylase subunit beta
MKRTEAIEAIYPDIADCNESLLSVGGFPTATSTGSDLAAIARASGIPNATTVRSVDELWATGRSAMQGEELSCIVAKVEAVGPKSFHLDVSLLENRFEFGRYVKKLDAHRTSAQGREPA